MRRSPKVGNTSFSSEAAIIVRVASTHAEARCSSHALLTASSVLLALASSAAFACLRVALGSTPSAISCRASLRRAGRLQRDSWIDPERQPLFLAAMPVLEAPSLATAWGHLDIEPAAIEEANSLVSELGVADRSVRKGHGGNSRIVGGNWT